MITRRALASRLAHRGIAAWTVVERDQTIGYADDALARTEHRSSLSLVVHHDVPSGRGSARLELDALAGSADDAIDDALTLATAAIGPAWMTSPPAAPARVALADAALAAREVGAIASSIVRDVASARAEVLREKVSVDGHGGFHTEWDATALRASALVVVGGRSLAVSCSARRLADLGLDTAVAAAAADLALVAAASGPPPSASALVLSADAMLHGGGFGIWSVFAHQADAVIERQGLTRYRLHSEVAPGAAAAVDPLVLSSDGALDYAELSAPLSDDGVAIRRFSVIDRGIASGLALSPREAALRGADPNGGMRNLVVAPGSWSSSLPAGALDVRRLGSFSVDLATGAATLELALSVLDGRPFTGGTIRLDLISALARARKSSRLVQRGAYSGPASVMLSDVELL
ncbi:MAG TPA: metallopeptidase TldD-related protein [Kofleriaceae bacterium]|jgi:predicted Zn-dependent protease